MQCKFHNCGEVPIVLRATQRAVIHCSGIRARDAYNIRHYAETTTALCWTIQLPLRAGRQNYTLNHIWMLRQCMDQPILSDTVNKRSVCNWPFVGVGYLGDWMGRRWRADEVVHDQTKNSQELKETPHVAHQQPPGGEELRCQLRVQYCDYHCVAKENSFWFEIHNIAKW